MTAKKNNPTIHPFGNTQQKTFISVLYLKKKKKKLEGSSLVAQQVKVQSCHCSGLGLLLWRGFSPWPGNFHMLQAWPQKK